MIVGIMKSVGVFFYKHGFAKYSLSPHGTYAKLVAFLFGLLLRWSYPLYMPRESTYLRKGQCDFFLWWQGHKTQSEYLISSDCHIVGEVMD